VAKVGVGRGARKPLFAAFAITPIKSVGGSKDTWVGKSGIASRVALGKGVGFNWRCYKLVEPWAVSAVEVSTTVEPPLGESPAQ
jgi:hypothetical protein